MEEQVIIFRHLATGMIVGHARDWESSFKFYGYFHIHPEIPRRANRRSFTEYKGYERKVK